jgi:O-antigen/teichoic acid export membrane protein
MMALNNAIDVGTAGAQQAGILLLLLAGAGVYLVAAWISTSVILGIIAYVVASARLVGWNALRPAFSVEVVRRTIGFTGHMMVISVLSLVQLQGAQVIVSKLLPIAEFGFYGFAASTVNRATFVTTAVSQAAFPSFSSLFAANDRPALLLQYRKLQDLVCFGTLPLFAGICFAALPVYTYVFNAGVAHQLLLPTAFLALGTWMNATMSIPYMLTVAMGKQQIASRTTVLATVFALPVTVLLVYRLGLNGAGLSWVYYHIFLYAYMVPRVCRECLGIRPLAWYQHVAKAIGVGAAAYGLLWVALVMPNPDSLPILIAAYVIATVAFAPIALLLIGPDLRFTLRQLRASLSKP